MSFLREVGEGEDKQLIRTTVESKVLERDKASHQNIMFLLKVGDEDALEIMTYNELSDLIAEQHDAEARGEQEIFIFDEILQHRTRKHKGRAFIEVLMKWSDGSETWEGLTSIFKTDPITVAKYAKEHNLLDFDGWKHCRKIARRTKVLQRMINNSKRYQLRTAPRYKFGVRVPRNYKEALELDKANGNDCWQEAVRIE